MELHCMINTNTFDFEKNLKIGLDNLIDEFTRQMYKNNCYHMDNYSIFINSQTYVWLCNEFGYMPIDIARYRGFNIEIDDFLRNGEMVMRENSMYKKFENARFFADVCSEFGGRQSGKTFALKNTLPVKHIINKKATILFWPDGDKTVVKRAKDDTFDKEKAFLWAYFLKHSDMSRNKANKYLRELEVEDGIN